MKNFIYRSLHFKERILWLVFAFMLFLSIDPTRANDQSEAPGSIEGIVSDKKTGESLIGANVIIEGTNIGTTTDFEGHFVLVNLKPGKYNLKVSYVSYTPVVFEDIKVEPVKSTVLKAELEEIPANLDAVTITATRRTNTDISMISSIKTSLVVSSGISAQQIQRTQDKDASEVVRKIPGVTIQDNKFIVVRGLNDRYNAVMLHNAYAPSMEADVRSFAFDIIPSSQIDRITIYKSPSAELPGDFAGGVVKIETKSIPEKSGIEIGYASSYLTNTTNKEMYLPERSSNYWTGFYNGYYDLPSGFPTNLNTVQNADEITRLGRSLKNTWLPVKEKANLNQGLSLTGNLKFRIKNIAIGSITALNYSNSKSRYSINRGDYGEYDPQINQNKPIYNFIDEQNNQHVRVGIIHNWGIRLNTRNSIDIKNMYNQLGTYRYTNRAGDHDEFKFYMNNVAFQQVFRGIYTSQVIGKHDLLGNTMKIEWVAGYSSSYRDMPDYRRYRTQRSIDQPDEELNIYIPAGGAQPFFLGRFYSNMDENSYSGSINISQVIPFKSERKPVISAGFFTEDKKRNFSARNIGYTQASYQFDQSLRYLSIDSLFLPENINSTTGIKIDEQSNPSDSYEASNLLKAYFLSLNLPITQKLTLITGLRIEDNTRKLISANSNGPVEQEENLVSLLPSVNLAYNFNDKSLIRAAYGKTLNRPEFREQAPFSFYDFDFNVVVLGNSYLETADIHNYDLRWEYYPSSSEMITAGLFYKDFVNPIEAKFLPGAGTAGSKNFTYGNAKSAISYGMEIDIKKSLAGFFQSSFLKDIAVLLNGALINSKIHINKELGNRDTDNRPLQGQSPYILNTGLYYSNDKKQFDISILYNLVGERIFSSGYTTSDRREIEYADVYEMDKSVFELTFSKALGKGLTLKGGIVTDILNGDIVFVQNADSEFYMKLDKNNKQKIQEYRPGTSFSLGLSYKF